MPAFAQASSMQHGESLKQEADESGERDCVHGRNGKSERSGNDRQQQYRRDLA